MVGIGFFLAGVVLAIIGSNRNNRLEQFGWYAFAVSAFGTVYTRLEWSAMVHLAVRGFLGVGFALLLVSFWRRDRVVPALAVLGVVAFLRVLG